MHNHCNRVARSFAGLVIVAVVGATPLVASSAASAWPVGSGGDGDVALEHFTITSKAGDTFVIPHVDFTNTNLSEAEITALLSPDTPAADEQELIKAFKADKISAPLVEITAKDGTTIKLHDVTASDVNAGRVGKFGMSGLEGSGTSQGSQVSIKSSALSVEGLDVTEVLKSVGGSGQGGGGRIDHLTWSGIDIATADANAGSTKHIHVAVGSVEVHSGYSGDVMKDGWSKITGVVFEPAADSDEGKNLASLGYSKIELALGVSANYKADAKTFSLDNFTLDGVQMGSLAVKAGFSDVEPGIFKGDSTSRLQALFGCGVVSVELRLVNTGLFEKALAFYAKQENSTPDALKQQWSAVVGQMAPLFLGGSPSALKAAAETQKFIVSPHNLTVAIKAKDGALKATDFMAISDPAAFVGKLDITAAANQ